MAPGKRETLILIAAGTASAAAGFIAGPLLLGTRDSSEVLRAARFVDLAGIPWKFSDWQGRVLVCNFWATWCAPCREEIPLLVAAKKKYGQSGVEIVGIAIDNSDKVVEFTRSTPISYKVIFAESNGIALMQDLGNSSGGLPYTVFMDREGRVAHRKLGALKQPELDAILDSLAVG